jgi:hypothetical protein
MMTGRAATALKYQRQCIEKGEQKLAARLERGGKPHYQMINGGIVPPT